MIYWLLFYEFFKTGLFAVGGGLATIPFLYDMMEKFGWFTSQDLMNMMAVSEATPGPMGVNMATYVGFTTSGNILGGVIATVGLVLPSVIIICIIASFLQKFKTNHWVQDVFSGLRPAVTGMLAATGWGVWLAAMSMDGTLSWGQMNWIHIGLFVVLLVFTSKIKKIHPILMIVLCAGAGILFQL
jgi:chromate transporter